MGRSERMDTGEIHFGGGVVPVAAFFLVSTAVVTGGVALVGRVFDGALSPFESVLFVAVVDALVALVAWGALRREGLRPADVGLSRRNLVPGVLVVAGIWLVVNLLGAGIALAGGGLRVGISPSTTVAAWLGLAVSQFLVVGMVEEFAYRGYLQNKFVSLFDGGSDRTRKVAAVLVATFLFTLVHIPQRLLVVGLSLPELVPALVGLFAYGLLFGVIYELTRNVVFAGVLHGTFNFHPVVVFHADWSPVNEVLILALPVVLVGVWAYRRWAKTARRADFSVQSGPAMTPVGGADD